MRPEQLTFEAFGSYLDRTVIDFSDLNNDGIFLICGPTGGGKTTLLDAISIALYGKATGSLRGNDWRLFRCRLAERSVDTFIEFIFSVGEERYRFVRRWRMSKSQGEDVLKDAENACYRYNGEDWGAPLCSGSARSLEAEAERILGLSHDQFVKVICLPQGEFRELLTTGSTERTKIFERLFGTARWKVIAETASRKAAATDAELGELRAHIDGLLSAHGQENATMLRFTTEEAVKNRDQLEQQITDISARLTASEKHLAEALSIDERFVLLDTRREQLAALDSQRDEITALSARLALHELMSGLLDKYRALTDVRSEQRTACEKFEKCENDAGHAEQLMLSATAAYEQLDEQRAKSAALHESLILLRSLKEKSDRLSNAQLTLDKCDAKLVDIDSRLSELTAALTDTQQRLDKGRELIALCDEEIAHIAEYTEQLTAANARVELFEQLAEKGNALSVSQAALADAEEKARLADSRLEDARLVLAGLEALVGADAAYALSLSLCDDAPCPVCGSCHHPQPATAPADIPSEKQLTDARERLTCAQTDAENCTSEAGICRASLGLLQEQYNQLRAQCDALNITSEQATALRDEAQQRLALANSRLTEKQRYQERLNTLDNQLASLRTQNDSLTNTRTECLSERASALSLRDSMLGELADNNVSPESLSESIAQCEKDCSDIDSAISSVTESYNNTRIANVTAQSELNAARLALDAVNQRMQRLESDYFEECAVKNVDPSCDIPSQMLSEGDAEDYRSRIEQFSTSYAALKQNISELEESTAGIERPRTEELRSIRDALLERSHELTGQHGQAVARAAQLLETLGSVEHSLNECDRLAARYADEKRISNYLTGINPKKTPIDQFVAGLLLDEVIVAANNYWHRLSRGQYALRRTSEVSGRAHYQGVNFEVIDTHIGGTRALATLSGGELFLASLSLAFGLSDVVQGFSGGLRLDSIFIDEGFGSLDRDTLDIALKAISEIREGRLIGIISHVDELRNRITSRLQIVKDDRGSHILTNRQIRRNSNAENLV